MGWFGKGVSDSQLNLLGGPDGEEKKSVEWRIWYLVAGPGRAGIRGLFICAFWRRA